MTMVLGLTRRLDRSDGEDGYAVRLDWADHRAGGVCHDLTQFTTDVHRAVRRAMSTRRFWSRGPVRPLAVTVVPVTRTAFRVHPGQCPASTCPTTAPLLGMDPAGLDSAPDRTPT